MRSSGKFNRLQNNFALMLSVTIMTATVSAWSGSARNIGGPQRTIAFPRALHPQSTSSTICTRRSASLSTATPTTSDNMDPPPPFFATCVANSPVNGVSSDANNNDSPQHVTQKNTGRVLEGGKVIDFGNVKASDRAEEALRQARQQYLLALTKLTAPAEHNAVESPSKVPLLGIHQDVIDLVGHSLADFCSPQEVQECAAWLKQSRRAQEAATVLFAKDAHVETNNGDVSLVKPSQVARFQSILNQAYEEAGEVTAAYAKTFYMGTMLLPEPARRAIWAIYVWCRRTDEIVDAPRVNGDQEMLMDLSAWELRLEQLWATGQVVDVYDLCLLDVRIQYPTLDITPFMDMIRGMLMDVPGLGQDRYDTFDQLHLYCYRVAGTVGVMSLPVFGCAQGFTDEIAREPALSLGVAFQLTNILRDVGEDAVQRGRVYLPQESLQRFGVTEDQIFEQRVDQNYIKLMKFEIDRARMYYERARRGVFMLAPESRLPVQSSLDAYGRILDKIEENGYDSLTKRAYVDKFEKLAIIPFSWYRTLDVSRVLPLPGDRPVDLTLA